MSEKLCCCCKEEKRAKNQSYCSFCRKKKAAEKKTKYDGLTKIYAEKSFFMINKLLAALKEKKILNIKDEELIRD